MRAAPDRSPIFGTQREIVEEATDAALRGRMRVFHGHVDREGYPHIGPSRRHQTEGALGYRVLPDRDEAVPRPVHQIGRTPPTPTGGTRDLERFPRSFTTPVGVPTGMHRRGDTSLERLAQHRTWTPDDRRIGHLRRSFD